MEILVEFILVADNFPVEDVCKEIDIHYEKMIKNGDVLLIGPQKDVPRIQTSSSLVYSTGYINTIDVAEPLQIIYNMLYPKKQKIGEEIKKYSLKAKFCITINLTENPIIGISKEFVELASDLYSEIEFDSYIQCYENEDRIQ